jgi:hypothetical protein
MRRACVCDGTYERGVRTFVISVWYMSEESIPPWRTGACCWERGRVSLSAAHCSTACVCDVSCPRIRPTQPRTRIVHHASCIMRIENLLATHQHPVVVSSNGVVLVRTPSALHVHVRLL